ncbi:MAG: hypothetical protein R2731_15960 [Nocardioides sp.]
MSAPPYLALRDVGQVRLEVVGPDPGAADSAEGSVPNNASLVLLAEVRGVRLLLTGDAEPPAQAFLARTLAGLHVDVLKVPHHGSRYQDLDLLCGLAADVAVVSVGADNDYGHPSPGLVAALDACGTDVWRTDRDGEVVVAPGDDGLEVRTSR